MTVENFDVLLEEFRNAKPYRIFTVELHSGQRFEVDHPEAMVRRRGVAVFLSPGGIPKYFDHQSVNQFIYATVSELTSGNPTNSTA